MCDEEYGDVLCVYLNLPLPFSGDLPQLHKVRTHTACHVCTCVHTPHTYTVHLTHVVRVTCVLGCVLECVSRCVLGVFKGVFVMVRSFLPVFLE